MSKGRGLAMAGPKSPWGEGDGTAEADPPRADDNAGDTDKPDGATAPRPLNPWLPPAPSEAERRTANIDDLFRQRAKLRPGGGAPFKRSWLSLLAAGLVAAWIGGTSVHYLGKGEQGLVTTFGRFDRAVGPGLTLTLPWPAQMLSIRNVTKIEETILPNKDGENLMLTRDRQLIDLTAKVRWRVTDLSRFAYASADTAALVARLANAEVHAAVAEQRFDELNEGQRRGELHQLIAARSQAAIDALKLGVRIEGVEVVRAGPPQKLVDAFRKVGEAREAARQEVSKATAAAQKILSDANVEADEFESVYVQYQASPEITRKRRYYEAMERVLVNNKVVVGGTNATVDVAPPAPTAPAAMPSPTGAP